MNNIEMYADFLDGAFSTQSERKFIDKFTNDEVFRSEFRHFILISKELSSNSRTFSPTDETNRSVYKALGFSMAEDNVVIKDNSSYAFLKSKLFSSILTGCLTALITYMIMLQYQGNSLNTNNNVAGNNKNFIENKAPIISNYSDNIQNNDDKVSNDKKINLNKYVIVNEIHDTIYRNTITSDNEILEKKEFHLSNSLIPGTYNPSIIVLSDKKVDNYIPHLEFDNKNLGITIELNNSTSWNFPQETISPSTLNKFNGLNLSILYQVNDFVKIGLGIDQETYYLVYSGTEVDNVTYRYRQQPNFTSISALLKLYPIELNQFKPFVISGYGINSGGYLARLGTGFEYNLNTNISFLFGIDYSNLWFTHQGAGFTASKAAMMYGLSYQF